MEASLGKEWQPHGNLRSMYDQHMVSKIGACSCSWRQTVSVFMTANGNNCIYAGGTFVSAAHAVGGFWRRVSGNQETLYSLWIEEFAQELLCVHIPFVVVHFFTNMAKHCLLVCFWFTLVHLFNVPVWGSVLITFPPWACIPSILHKGGGPNAGCTEAERGGL